MAEYTPENEQRYLALEADAWTEWRAKYKQSDRDEMAKSGEAMSDGSYPIKDEEDLKNAIRAVGRGGASHDAIRAHIMARAKVLELSNLIPENWNSDGSLKDARGANGDLEARADHAAFSGTHSHSHPAFGSQGGDANHSHSHSHDNDSDHGHSHAQANAGPDSLEWRKRRAEERGSVERRLHPENFELREDLDGTLHLSGYASTTNQPYDMQWYTERIARGAFKKTLGESPDVTLNLNHGEAGSGLPIARTKAGNLKLTEDTKGLRVEADLDPADPDVQLLARKMSAGNLDGQMSFAFRPTRHAWNEDYTDREILECDIHRGDVSVVTQGANPNTSSSIRSWEDNVLELRSLVAEEVRVGKTISSATKEKIQHAIDTLNDLISAGQPDDDDDSGTAGAGDGGGSGETLSLPTFDRSAERLRLEARRYPNGRVA